MKFFVFIDGKFVCTRPTLEEAKKECYCGDVYHIYEAKLVYEEPAK